MPENPPNRRLAAILAADVVGYSRLMAEDEAGTLERLKLLRRDLIDPSIAAHRGRIVKLMGDGTLVEFGSVVDAVQCAVAIQRAIRSADRPGEPGIAIRIGINLGDIIVEGDDIYGDGVNIAARLQEVADPGGILVSGTVLEHIGGRAKIEFEDRGEQRLKNIDRPVRTHRVRLEAAEPMPNAALPTANRPERSASIAVLPFTNLSGDPGQDYFADGITEDIITELSRFRPLFVIARNSSFAFKHTSPDIREVGRKLGVRYVVEGSVRRAANRIRVTAQLIDAAGGNHLWAERYDRELADIFDVQDEVTRHIVANVAPRLQIADYLSAKRQRPEDMLAYDYYLQAKPLIDAPVDVKELVRGREYCNRALAVDHNYARAHAYLAASYIVGVTMMEVEDPGEWEARALASAERAVALDDLDSFCQHTMGEAAFMCRQPERALRHIRKAVAINPHDADILTLGSYIEISAGDPAVGLQQIAIAFERNPTNPPWYHWIKGIDFALLGRFDEALAEYAQFGPPNPGILKMCAVALVQLGRLEEARNHVRALLSIMPNLTAGKIAKLDGNMPDVALRVDSLRRAGLPE